MADRVVPVHVRSLVVGWAEDAPRGAVTQFCDEHGVSRSWFYEVRARARVEGALSALQPRPRQLKAGRHPQAIPLEVEDLAVQIRKELADRGWDHGPVTVRHRLQQLGVAAPAAATLARVFTARGMVTAQPQKRPRASYRRFQYAMIHECWQLDAFEWALADGSSCAIFQLLDDHSRYMIASLVATAETAAAAIAVVKTGIARFQVPCLLLSDNGSALNQTRIGRRSQLVTLLETLGCRPITGRPGHPQSQGKDERAHATLQARLRAQPPAASLAELQTLVDTFDLHYNQHRPHQALHMRTPAEVLAHGPVAIPPRPPHPATPTPRSPAQARQHRVAANGNVSVRKAAVQIGREHANTDVTVVISAATVNIFDNRGRHIRTVVLTPGTTYYGNGQPRGRRTKPNRPH